MGGGGYMWNCRVINPLDIECYVEDTCEEEDTCRGYM